MFISNKSILYIVSIKFVLIILHFSQLCESQNLKKSQIELLQLIYGRSSQTESDDAYQALEPDPSPLMNSFEDLIQTAIKEEQIFELAKQRYERLTLEVKILKE
jgi:hypothetical protein